MRKLMCLIFIMITINILADINDELFEAVKKNNLRQVKELVNKGANINTKKDNGATLLMYAENIEIAKYLAEKGIDINAKRNNGTTALSTENIVKLEYLLQKGINVNEQDETGTTALGWSTNTEKIKILVKYGADFEIKDNWGRTPLMCVLDINTMIIMIELGANIYAINDNGEDVLEFYYKEAYDEHDTYGKEEMLKQIAIFKKYIADYKKISKIIKSYKNKNDLKKIIDQLEKANIETILKYKPKYFTDGQYIQVINNYAYFLSETERYKEAIPILENVIKLSSKRAVAYLNLGDCYYKEYLKNADKNTMEKVKYNYQQYKSLLNKNANIPERVKKIIE